MNEVALAALVFFLARSTLYFISRRKWRLEVIVGTTLYGLTLGLIRLVKGAWLKLASLFLTARSIKQRPKRAVTPRYGDLEVVLGHNRYGREIRIDFARDHTMIGGMTGSGKTNLLHSILIQLFSRSSRFSHRYEVWLFALKPSETDQFQLWRPAIRYFAAGVTHTIDEIIEEIRLVANDPAPDKKRLIIIDEVSQLMLQAGDQKQAIAAISQLLMQFRDRGKVIITTQHPHFQNIPRQASAQTERKICFRVDRKEVAKLIMGHYPKDYDPTNFLDGEFALRDHRFKYNEHFGRTHLVKLPEDIQQIIETLVKIESQQDKRLKLFVDVAAGLKEGQQLPGVNKITPVFDGVTNQDVQIYYRNYALAGATSAKMGGQKVAGYLLAKSFEEAYSDVSEYIKAGWWQAAPEPLANGHG